jgi:uncharacterized membrane protein
MSADASIPGTTGAAPSDVTSNDRLWAALAYIIPPIISVLILVMEENKTREFQRYHAFQAIGFAVVAAVYTVLLCIVSGIATAVLPPLACIFSLLYVVPVIPALYFAYQAYQGQRFEIPVITEFMRQQKWL